VPSCPTTFQSKHYVVPNSEILVRLPHQLSALSRSLVICSFFLAVASILQGCSATTNSATDPPPGTLTVTVSPTSASVVTTKTQQFTASVANASNPGVSWHVNGVSGGDAAHGTISSSGMYAAPATVPNPATVTVTAVSQQDASKSATASLTVVSVSDSTAPSSPSNLTGTALSASQINLSWTASTDSVGVTGYQIERCVGNGCSNFALVTTTTATTFNNTGLLAGTAYGYRVRATDAAGNLSPYSNIVSAITQGTADTTAPSAPSALSATTSSATQIALNWVGSADNIGVTGYLVERCSGASCTAFAQVSTTAGATTFSDSGLAASTSYSYRVRATDAAGNLSGYSNIATATTSASSDTTPPSAPSGLDATATSTTQIGLTWAASTDNIGVTGYHIERCAGTACSAFVQIGTTTGATTFSDSGLTASTAYRYRLRANDAAGNLSAYSNIAAASTSATVDTTPPTAPSSLAATASSTTQIGLAWTASTDNVGVSGYHIERCAGAGCTTFIQVGTTTGATTFSDSGLTISTVYRYRVRANDATGNLSTYSNIAAATTLTTADTTPPTAPSTLVATASSSTQIGLTWTASTDNVGVTGYRIERCSGASCATFAQIGTTTGTTNFGDSGLTNSTSYSYRVRATDAAGNLSGYSNTASATTSPAADTTPPAAPSALSANAINSSEIDLSWTASTDNVGVTGYRIESCSGASCTTFAQIGTTTGATTFAATGLAAGTSYSFRVRAIDAAGNLSGYSNTASGTTSSGGGGGTSITVSVSPRRGGLVTSQTLSIAATLTNDAGNQGVNWTASGGSFLPSTSTSGNAVAFTAPASAGVVTITATSVADGSKSATATIGVTDLSGVLTYHNNLSRDGANQKEYALTPSNVSTSTFGKLFSCPVDGALYAQPLWVPKVSIGGGTHNVIVVATMRDSVYVFDADTSPCVTYWNKQYLPAGETWGTYSDIGSSDIFPDIGILGTPVISSGTIYFVSKSKNTSSGAYQQRLHAVSLTDGSERSNSPVAIDSSITYSGTCDGGSSIAFDPLRQNQRPGLALVNGTVYVAWGSHGDVDAYHGWVLGYNASSLARTNTWNSSPNKLGSTPYCRNGIWMSGGAPAADSSNNLFLMTGNGVFDADTGGSNYGDSYMKLTSGLAVSDWFTPHDQSNLDDGDQDVGSGGTALLIDQTSGPITHLMVGAGKSGTFYVLNRDNLGHFTSNDAGAVQTWSTSGRSFSTPAFWNNSMYYFGVTFGTTKVGEQYAFDTSTGQFTTTPASTTPTGLSFPGATPSISASGTSNGVVWAIDNSKYGTNNSGVRTANAAILHAYSASNLGTELWNSTQGSGNAAWFAVKFTVPTVANGKVYVGTRGNDNTKGSGTTFGEIDVYGLLP